MRTELIMNKISKAEVFGRCLSSQVVHFGTKKELSEKTGISYQTIIKYCNGKKEPTLEDLCTLCSVLDCSADYLLGMNGAGKDNYGMDTINEYNMERLVDIVKNWDVCVNEVIDEMLRFRESVLRFVGFEKEKEL